MTGPDLSAIDGPMADEPWSLDTLVIDLMQDPATLAVLNRLAPDLMRAPAAFGGGWLAARGHGDHPDTAAPAAAPAGHDGDAGGVGQ